MAARNPRVDAYIAKSADFAQPILTHLRELVHEACPEVEEKIKWGMPFFDYRGSMCHMAGFRQHCAFGFWKGKLLFANDDKVRESMGHFGRIASLKDLPARPVLMGHIKQAMQLNETGVKAPPRGKAAKSARWAPAVPDDLRAALNKNKKALQVFDAFSPSCQREYVDWIVEAKRDETRARRIAQTIEWVAQGKQRNWKYQPS